jgi:hypothetical protein
MNSRIRKTILSPSIAALIAGISMSANAVEPITTAETGSYSDVSEYVGFQTFFSRFPDGIVKLAYDHTGAAEGTTVEEALAILNASFAMIEGICGIDFQFQGQVTSSPGDPNDDIVDISWFTEDSTTLADAGPSVDPDIDKWLRLGYFPYTSGTLRFNTKFNDPSVSTTVHELMHLVGLSHSETPIAIMRPEDARYNLPQPDDIAGLQAMYGPPDVLKVPSLAIDLAEKQPTDGMKVDTLNSNFVLSKTAADGSFIDTNIQTLGDGATDDFLLLDITYAGSSSDTKLAAYLTDPNGFTNRLTDLDIDFSSDNAIVSLDSYAILAAIAGDWKVTLGNAGRQLAIFTLPVAATAEVFNKNPTASLTWTRLASNQFKLEMAASDPEGDDLLYKWYIPGQGEILDAGNSITVTATSPNPIIAFGTVQDTGTKRTGENSTNSGFGAVISRYIVMPAEENIATYYVQEKILHIPSLDIGGQVLSVNLKLTALPTVEYKLLEYDLVANFAGTAGSTLDLNTAVITMPKMIVSDNGTNSTLENFSLKLVPGSQPIRFGP